MADKLKSIIQDLPAIEPKKSVEEMLAEIIKRRFIWLWERRLSILAGATALVFGFLTVKQSLNLARWLGTADFWRFLSWDKVWFWQEPAAFWQAFREANPLKEVIFLLFLLTVLIYSLKILTRQMFKRKGIYSLLVLLALLSVTVSVGWHLLWARPKSVFSPPAASPTPVMEQEKTVALSQPTAPPFFLQLSAPQDKITVNTDRILIIGRTVPDAEVFINENQVTPQADGSFRFNLPLAEGENPILISAGNENGDQEIELTVYYELP